MRSGGVGIIGVSLLLRRALQCQCDLVVRQTENYTLHLIV